MIYYELIIHQYSGVCQGFCEINSVCKIHAKIVCGNNNDNHNQYNTQSDFEIYSKTMPNL